MVEVLKLGDTAGGPCVPQVTTFVGAVGALSKVFIGQSKSSILVQGDLCSPVACPAACTPALASPETCCSLNVFAGPASLPVAKSTGVLTCGYVAATVIPSLVNVN